MNHSASPLLAFLVATSLGACSAEQRFGTPPTEQAPSSPTPNEPTPSDDDDDDDLVHEPAAPASDWTWLNPRPHGNDLRAVDATADNNLWVGGRGEVLAWDGASWQNHRPSDEDVAYHALYVAGPNDVWAGGTALSWHDDQASQRSVLSHFDGSTWSPWVELGEQAVHALDGAGGDAWLALGNGEIRRLVEQEWTTDAHLDGEVRGLWVLGPEQAWAVGDQGLIARRSESGWQVLSGEGDGDPFGADRHYLAVWGSGPDDVWATFETHLNEVTSVASASIGFSHFDGEQWRVETVTTADCSDVVGLPAKGTYFFAPAEARGTFVTRRGALLAGRSASDVVASIGGGRCLWHYDGSVWSPLVQTYYHDEGGGPGAWYLDFPLGRWPAVAATSSTFLVAGQGGRLMSLQPDVTEGPEPLDAWAPAFEDVFEADRRHLTQPHADRSGTYVLADGAPAVWTAGGYQALHGPPGTLDPIALADPNDVPKHRLPHHLVADGAGRLWTFGGYAHPYAAYWDDVEWHEVALPQPGPAARPISVWSSPSGVIWWTNLYGVHRIVDGEVSPFEVPAPAGYEVVYFGMVTGSADDDVWIDVVVSPEGGASYPLSSAVMRFDGESVSTMHHGGSNHHFLRAFAPDRVLVIDNDGDELLYDGTGMQPLDWPASPIDLWYAVPGTRAAWFRDVDDAYAIGSDALGSHVFHFDGQAWTRVLSSDHLQSVHGDGTSVWAVGRYGSTVRATLPPPPPQ